jgi:hypothetical protein
MRACLIEKVVSNLAKGAGRVIEGCRKANHRHYHYQGFNCIDNRKRNMGEPKYQAPDPEIATSSPSDDRRKGEERRKLDARGFTRISIVGWICRREQFRRALDSHRCSVYELFGAAGSRVSGER